MEHCVRNPQFCCEEPGSDDPGLGDLVGEARSDFEVALDDDLNISGALAAVFEVVREANRRVADRRLSSADAHRLLEFLRDLDRVLGILPDGAEPLPKGALELLDARAAARAARDWAASDRLRDDLAGLGVSVEDTRDGQRWRRLEPVS